MSEDKKQKDPVILEAEIIDETADHQGAHKSEQSTDTKASGPTKADSDEQLKDITPKSSGATKSGRWGWRFAGGLTLILAGMVTAPYADKMLIKFGLLDESLIASGYYSAQDASKFTSMIQGQLQTIAARVDVLKQQIEAEGDSAGGTAVDRALLAKQAAALETVRRDVDALAGKIANQPIGAGGGETSQLALSVQTLTTTVTAQQEEINRLAQLLKLQTAKDTTSLGDSQQIKDKITALEGALSLARSDNKALLDRIAALEAAFTKMETETVKASPRSRLLYQVTGLQRQVKDGIDIGPGLKALGPDIDLLPVKDQVAAYTVIKQLELDGTKHQRLSQFQAEYPALASAIKKAEGKKDGGLLSGLVTVRKKGAAAEGLDKVLFDAETALTAGRLEQAVELLENGVPAHLLIPAKDWLTEARRKLKAEALLADLLSLVTDKQEAGS